MANGSMAYDLSLFEPPKSKPPQKKQQATKKSKAKKRRKQTFLEKNGVSTVCERKTKTVSINRTTLLQVAAPLLICMICLPLLLFAKAEINELDKQISSVEAQIEIQEGEAVRLNAELSGMLSASRIEEIAEEELGMVKAESYQITYIDLSEGDEIVVSGDKIPGKAGDLSKKIEQLFARMFG